MDFPAVQGQRAALFFVSWSLGSGSRQGRSDRDGPQTIALTQRIPGQSEKVERKEQGPVVENNACVFACVHYVCACLYLCTLARGFGGGLPG